MQVALVVPGALDQPTGGYLYDAIVSAGLRARGRDVAVVSLAPNEGPRELLGRLDALRPDVVVADELAHEVLAPALPDVAAARVLLVHHLRGWEALGASERAAVLAAEHACVAAADVVVATSGTTRERLARETSRGDVVAIEPGADRLARVRGALAPPPRRAALELLFVGSWVARKRLDLLLDAVDLLAREHDVRLAIAGDPSREPEHARALRARIAASPRLRERVETLGVIDDASLAARLGAADLLVLPSSLEGFGMAAAEAVAAGLPVVASDAGALPEVLRDGAEARLFPAGDGAALAALLARLARAPAELAAMRAAALARAPALPTWERAVERFDALLSEARRRDAPRGARARAR